MSALRRSLTVPKPIGAVAGYLCDLTTSVEWDPHTVSCRRLDAGAVRVGARYEHVRAFSRYLATVEFEVIEYVPHAHIAWRGTHRFADGREEFAFQQESAEVTTVTHAVDIRLRGIAGVMGDRMLPAVIRRVADDGTDTLRNRLEQLP